MKEKQKAKAIELMKQIGIYKPYIDGFEKEDQVCFFEQFAGFWVYQEPDIEAKMKQLEKEYECRVYAITDGGFSYVFRPVNVQLLMMKPLYVDSTG